MLNFFFQKLPNTKASPWLVIINLRRFFANLRMKNRTTANLHLEVIATN